MGNTPECRTITLAKACRTIGISLNTATKLLEHAPAELPPVFKIGCRRYVLRQHFEQWLDKKAGVARSP